MKKFQLFSSIILLLLLATQYSSAQSSTGTKQAAGAIASLKGILNSNNDLAINSSGGPSNNNNSGSNAGSGSGIGSGAGAGSGISVNGSGSGGSASGAGASAGSSSGIGSIYKPGWSKEKVLAYPKGSRPQPVTYLTEAYYTDHINRFKTGGGAFMIVEKWIETSPYPNFAPRKFVMLKSDMEKVMAKYYQTGKVEDIEDGLGYRRGDLKGLDAEIHVIYVDSTQFKFEFANGNEIGANDLWEPGGKTSGGYRECVIVDKTDPAKTIVHNKKPEFLHSPYAYRELIYQQGWDNKKVRETAKGSRPLPATYLINKYIANHIKRFKTEGGAFIVVKKWVEDTASSFTAFPLRKFVMLRSDMDKVVARYQETGEISEIEDALGYTPGTLTGLEDDLYVFYLDKTKYIFELPTGNEIGANSLWEPEARTSGGFLECVVVDRSGPNKPIVHNKSILNLQNQFSYIKVSGVGSNSIYQPGWSKSRVLAFPKGTRPNPSTYLTAAYFSDHLNRFKTEGGAFMIVEKWIKTSPFPNFALRKFVMLRSDMDKVMAKYYQTGDIINIEDALGYKRGDLKGFDAEIHVIYVDSTRFAFQLPDGNEIGANDLWEPGGKTSGGYRECVVIDKTDPAKTIVHNKNPEFLHSPYAYRELIYQQGWDNKKVRETAKGSRPLPATYLINKYIANHIKRFNTEGGAFLVVKRWVEDPASSFTAFPLRKFVMLRSDMDRVVAQYRQSNNVQDIEDALGYTRGQLAGLEDDLFVFYLDKTKFTFELPTGNEIGANSLWEPEARTSGGFLECVVINKAGPSIPITHNKDIQFLKSQFTNIKVKL
jgi:hypothetical protein